MQVTWSAHNAVQIREQGFAISMSALMPLLRDQAHDIPTIKHVMDKVKETTSFLYPTQTPVITADQPLFALAKQIQWHWPDEYGNFVVMMGALHIEMAALRMVGRILKGSGWTTAIEESAESFLSVANVTKTRRAHQVTVCSLYSLMKAAYEKKELHPDVGPAELGGTDTIFQEWCNSKSEIPQVLGNGSDNRAKHSSLYSFSERGEF